MIQFQKVLNLPSWWPGDVGRIEQKLAEEIKKCNFPPDKEKLILSAWETAKEHHSPQTRADGVEYVIHVYRVTLSLILEFGESSSMFILAALLHDILEDTGYTCQEMTKAFGEDVTRLIESITRREGENRPKKGDRLQDKYFEKIIKSGVDSIKLKLADKLDNIRDALNHPKIEKRRIYVRECQTVFLPLIKNLGNPVMEGKIYHLFEEAMSNHPCYLDQVLLFNPALDCWVTSDNVQRVKIPLSTKFTAVDLVKSVAIAIINKIETGKIDSLLYIADLPAFLNNPAKKNHWNRVKDQLNALKELLSLDTPPEWLKPILETPEYLLPVVHSRLFMPASWLFPLWQKDYGHQILEANKETYLSLFEKEITEKWVTRLHLLLICRKAFWRYITGNGECSADIVLSEIKKSEPSLGPEEYRLLVSMRLLTEYLDAKDDLSIHPLEENFSELWIQLISRYDPGYIPITNKVEFIGFDKVRGLCPGLEDRLSYLRGILMEFIAKDIGPQPVAWINFNTREIEKRLRFFQEALREVDANTPFDDLQGKGIYVQQDRLEDIVVFTIEPDNWDALKDRIPETTDAERTEIRNKNYSAVAIFDVLLMKKLDQKVNEPIWVPRVYRILDTMSDFDPLNVQPVTVSFQSEEKIKNNIVYLPIPTLEESDEQTQAKRKEIVARYIVTMIYNYVVTLGIYSAAVDCSPLDENKVKLGFTNHELEHGLRRWAETLGYEKIYGRFLEDFNFKKFAIKAALCPNENTGFTVNDITGYGSFLGIDIGGTFIKVSLFKKGEITFSENPILTFKTFEQNDGGHVPVTEFCNRIISEVEAGFKKPGPGSNFSWEELEGVGISWPGAVSGSKIIATSGVLRRLSFQEGGKTVNLYQDSSPHDIHSIDVVGVFYKELKNRHIKLSDSFVVTVENDGNAEAYGNYCHLMKEKMRVPGGKLIIKLGTSTAGGHVNNYGAISPHVAEFAKIILDFNFEEGVTGIQGAARDFVSSLAVRQLSRTFRFNGELLFGALPCQGCNLAMNESDSQKTRLEAIEIGKLLNFFILLHEKELKDKYLEELVEFDNRCGGVSYPGLLNLLADRLQEDDKMKEVLNRYIRDRGIEEFNRVYNKTGAFQETDALIWRLGISRMRLLLQIQPSCNNCILGEIPNDFDYVLLAKKILGAVALYSQLGFQISHLVVSLYNIYKKERFSEVILAGGVLGGETGKLLVRQAESFLSKYYNKIFGPGKHLKQGSVRLATAVANPDTVGPFGAAMVANRIHKMNSLAVMEKEIDYRVRDLRPGASLSLEDMLKFFKGSRVSKEDILDYLGTLMSKSILMRRNPEEEVYVKVLIPD